MTMMKRKIANTDLLVGELGFGAATLGNLFHKITDQNALQTALNAGINQFDTAPYYGFGLSERRVGDGLREIDVNDYVLSTKVGRILEPCAKAEDKYGFCSPMLNQFLIILTMALCVHLNTA